MVALAYTRRSLLMAGAAVATAGLHRFMGPASAKDVAATPSMRGGANNYRPGAPLVERIGGGGFWMSGTAPAMARLWPVNAFRFVPTPPRAMSVTRTAMAQHSPTKMASFAWRCRRSFLLSAKRMRTLHVIVAISKPSSCGRLSLWCGNCRAGRRVPAHEVSGTLD
jgi:hypothetical protein